MLPCPRDGVRRFVICVPLILRRPFIVTRVDDFSPPSCFVASITLRVIVFHYAFGSNALLVARHGREIPTVRGRSASGALDESISSRAMN